MTGPGWLVLSGIAATTLAEIAAALLNLTRLGEAPDRVRAYQSRSAVLGITRRLVSLNLLAAVWISGGFLWLEDQVDAAVAHPIVAGLCFFGLLSIGTSLIDLPFRMIRTFRIERDFGFNRTSPGLFTADWLRDLLLSMLLGGALLGCLLTLLDRAGPGAWLPAWGATAALLLIVSFLAPVVIFPLFNRFTPLPESPLRTAIADLCAHAGFRVREVFQMDGSRRSSRANAFFAGIGPTRRVALFDTLIERHTEREVLAVVAHELGHARGRHVASRLLATVMLSGLILFLGSWLLRTGTAAHVIGAPADAGLALPVLGAALVLLPLTWVFGIAGLAWSRRQEFEADRFAADLLSDAEPMRTALSALGTDQLSHPAPHPLAVWLGASHPPIGERVARLKSTAQ